MSDRIAHWIARHLPKRITYWCAIVVGCHATSGEHDRQDVPSLTFMDALKRWEK